ncbi:MAG: phthalate 4,5-cis-dihydrodiol dehydrogenase [Alphaproteobacteria bacterium]|jgi:phthalate 4,5-cis-dihydrodiol dehydrogenase|nr:phthalate 4,5-cis-dihydrodiol dehydrogenase [Alphaproteobacteria bacterium]
MARVKPLLRLGIIGLGGATKQMLPSLISHEHVRVVAGADARPEARERFAAEFGALVFESAEQLCESPEVDAVYIATPHQWHKAHALLAAEGGKHIIVEKPMALTVEDCDAMIEAAARNKVHMIVGHTHSYNPPIMKMREIIRSEELGPVAMINTWNYTNFLYRPRRPEELRTELGGGIIYNQVPHQVDVVRLLGGGLVRSVRSMAWMLDPSRPTEGSHLTFLQFEDGSAASMVFSGYDYFDSDEFHFWVGELGDEKPSGQHGSARAGLRKAGGTAAEAALKSSAAYGGAAPKAQMPDRAPGRGHHPHFGITIVSCALGDMRPSADGVRIYGQQGRVEVPVPLGRVFPDKGGVIDEMYETFVSGRPPLHNGAWGRATMEVCEAILTSARERREIVLSLQTPVND